MRYAVLTIAIALALAAPAQANHHFMRITEVFAGTGAQPNAEFVELRAYSPDQNIVAPKRVRVYDASGAIVTTATFTQNVADASSQMTVLIATPQAATYFGVTPDLTMTAGIPAAGGKVCWESTNTVIGIVDCVSWGSYSGPDTGKGEANPVNPSGGMPAGFALLRDISAGNPANLEVTDDTDSSAADFDLVGFASPRNNAGVTTTTASQVDVSAGLLRYDSDAANVANRVVVNPVLGGHFRVVENGAAPLHAGPGCNQERVDAAKCLSPAAGEVTTGGGNDQVTIGGALPVTLTGEAGGDTLRAGGGADTLAGGPGNDTLVGGAGVDDLDGGDANDTLDGGTGADDLDGGVGVDTASWADRTATVVVDIDAEADDGNADDGLPGARDVTSDTIENLTGGSGDDELTGSLAANVFDGGAGSDLITGGGGVDTISYAKRTAAVSVDLQQAEGGDATVDGAPLDTLSGIRSIIGGAGGDTLVGSTFPNRITGGAGVDSVSAGGANDTVLVRDGAGGDSADCGFGADKIQADTPGDTLTSCETPF
jgi:Ca2+-binding RTX toxin-like protein